MGTHRRKPSSEAATELSGAPGLSTSAAEDDVVVQKGLYPSSMGSSPPK